MNINPITINKAFFGKDNCLKIIYNKERKECYFHFGISLNKQYTWKKLKFNDAELGSILLVLYGRKPSIAFFHKYNDSTTQIWVNRQNEFVFVKIKELSKSLNEGEQEVMRILLEHIVLDMNRERPVILTTKLLASAAH
jgi:hypothetical protein